jgi:hypothetical protein
MRSMVEGWGRTHGPGGGSEVADPSTALRAIPLPMLRIGRIWKGS